MIVVVARARVHPQRRQEFIDAARAVAPPTRAEEGCRSYRIHEDVEDAGVFVFVEEWRDQADLDRHFGSLHVKRFFELLPAMLAAPAELRVHEVARTTTGE